MKVNSKYRVIENEILTVKSFFGESGIEYSSLDECKRNNKKGSIIMVKNIEYNEANKLEACIPVENEKAICPECLSSVSQDELNIFGGLCEECTNSF